MSRIEDTAVDHRPASGDGAPPTADAAPAAGRARARLLAGLPVEERRMKLAGIQTAVFEGGEGVPLLLLHGPGSYALKWGSVLPDLVETHRVIAPDLPGHGASTLPEGGPLGMELILEWLDELIGRACDSPPVLVGQVLGGAIAARFAIDRGDRIDRLVLVDSLGLAPFDPAPEFGAALSGFMEAPTDQRHDRLWEQCTFDLSRLRSRMGERWRWLKAYNLDRARSPDGAAAVQELMGAFGFPGIPEQELDRIDVPTYLIWGRHDLATGLEVAEAASERHGWRLQVIEDCRDDPPLERPEAFVAALRAALGEEGGGAGHESDEGSVRSTGSEA